MTIDAGDSKGELATVRWIGWDNLFRWQFGRIWENLK
jgi:hypothetical protein